MGAPKSIPLRRDLRSPSSNVAAELGLLALCILAGAVGVHYEDVKLALTIFLGGLGVWLAMSVPSMIQAAKQKAEQGAASAKANAGAAAGAAAAGAAAAVVPGPEAVLGLIRARRSVFPKDYNGAKIPRDQIEQLLEAANWAPTHNVTQPWKFVVLEGAAKQRFEEITLDCVAKYTQPADKAAEAVERMKGKAKKTWPLVSHYIVICMTRPPAKGTKPNPEWEDLAAVACAAQNMQLQATALRLGCYWSSWQEVARTAPEMASFLGIDAAAGEKCYGVLLLGSVDSERLEGYRGSRKPIADRVAWRSSA